MRAVILALLLAGLCGIAVPMHAASTRLVKVLPQFLDRKGRVALNPSLYERDAYQAQLRARPDERSGLRFAVHWKSRNLGQVRLRVEMRGNRANQGTTATLEETVKFRGLLSSWSFVALTGEHYQAFGELSAWRATLWDGDQMVAEQTSFLW